MEDLPAPWVRRQSRTRRAPYAFNPVTSETAWLEDDAGAALLAGWGWREADPTRPDGGGRVYVHLATGATRAGPPSESDAAAADGEGATGVGGGRLEPQRAPAPLLAGVGAGGEPAEGNVLFDVFSPAFRSREPWRFAQLGLATAAVEVAWWEAIAAGMGRRAADRAAAAAAANTDAQDVTAPRLIAAAVRALGPKRFADGWDPRRRAYVVQREAVPGEDRSDPPPGAGAKRARHDAADAEPASGGAAGPPRLQLRDPADFAVAPGGSLFTDPRFPCNAVAAGVYASGRVTTGSGLTRRISAAIGPREHRYLYSLVRDNKLARCVEVGMANGLSALAICQALHDNAADGTGPPAGEAVLVSVDPFQTTQWDNTGRSHLARAGLSAFSSVVEEPSHLALPQLLRPLPPPPGGGAPPPRLPFDLVLVDGMHLFDYTLLDAFFADQLLRVGGVVVVDDCRHRGVRPAVDFLAANYRHWRLLPRTLAGDTMATFHKAAPDARAWDFHAPFSGGGGGGGEGGRERL